MHIGLLNSRDQFDDGPTYDFVPGALKTAFCNKAGVSVSDSNFDLMEKIFFDAIPDFNPYGPTTISGRRIRNLAEALQNFENRVAEATCPEDIWHPQPLSQALQNIEDWQIDKARVCLLLRDLRNWLSSVETQKQAVTILGL